MLLGKFAWAIERDSANKVIGLWPLRAQHIRPVPSISGPGYFSSFHYGYQGQQGYREFKPNEIVYIWKPSLRDFREAESAVNVAALNINVAKMLDTFDFNFLKNGAVPSNMVVTPPFATDDDRDRFRMQFEADFGGVSNAGKTIFSERTIEGEGPLGGQETVDVKILGLSQRDAQLSVLSDKEISAITIAFGVPLSILGDSSHRTFSNAFQDRRNYWLETLLPKSREIQDGINVNLAPLLDPGGKTVGWFDTSGVPELRGDPAIPDMQAVSWRDAGLVTEDEIRADRGLPPGKDVGLDKVWAQLAADKEQAKKTMTQNAASSVAKQAGGQVVAPAKAPAASAPAASRSLPTSALESVLAGSVRNLLAEVQTVVAQRSESRRSHRPAFDVPFWEARAVSALSPVLVEMGLTTSQVETLAKLITKDTEQHYLTGLDADITVFCAARFVEEATAVPVVEVRQALVDIYLGSSTVEVALAGIGATP
jgi:HK97 family phage portal protein